MPWDEHQSAPAASQRRLGHQVLTDEQWCRIGNVLGLSGRQLEIVQCIFDDHVEARIALQLGISEHTVHTHVERLYRKLGVSSRCELLVRVFAEYVAGQRGAAGDDRAGTESD